MVPSEYSVYASVGIGSLMKKRLRLMAGKADPIRSLLWE